MNQIDRLMLEVAITYNLTDEFGVEDLQDAITCFAEGRWHSRIGEEPQG